MYTVSQMCWILRTFEIDSLYICPPCLKFKSVNFWQSYWKNKRWTFFGGTQCITWTSMTCVDWTSVRLCTRDGADTFFPRAATPSATEGTSCGNLQKLSVCLSPFTVSQKLTRRQDEAAALKHTEYLLFFHSVIFIHKLDIIRKEYVICLHIYLAAVLTSIIKIGQHLIE